MVELNEAAKRAILSRLRKAVSENHRLEWEIASLDKAALERTKEADNNNREIVDLIETLGENPLPFFNPYEGIPSARVKVD